MNNQHLEQKLSELNFADLTRLHNECKAKRLELEHSIEAEVDRYKEFERTVKRIVGIKFNELGIDNVKTDFGTPYVSNIFETKTEDASKFLEFLKKYEAWYLLDIKPNTGEVKKFLEKYKQCPPGVDASWVKRININTKGAKKS